MMNNNIIKTFSVLVALAASFSCSYLDVVPPEQPDLDDMMVDEATTTKMLYSCYSYAQNTRSLQFAGNLDMGSDECVMPQEWESYASRVQWNSITPSSINGDGQYVWTIWYNGIGYCNLFLKLIEEQNPPMNPNLREQFICEAKFLKAWYHFRLLQLFGPIPIVDHFMEANQPKSDFPGRSHFDYCVKYICDLLDEAAEGLPANYSNYSYYGRATSIACKAIKARVLVLAASPLWNGEFPDKTWCNTSYETPGYGKELVSHTYDATKWTKARDAMAEAVRLAEAAGAELFTLEDSEILRKNQNIGLPVIPGLQSSAASEPFKKRVILMRYVMSSSLNDGNTETVWGFVHQGTYVDNHGTVMSSLPHYILKNDKDERVGGYGGLSPTLYAVEHFFTKNGFLPQDDPSFCPASEYHKSAGLGNTDITKINVDRDPRYYAAISFDGDEYSTKVAGGHSLYCEMRDNTKTGYDPVIWGTRNYVVTGWLNKKWVHPNYQYTGIGWNSNYSACRVPMPIVRLAEMYLSLAECEAQCGNDNEAIVYMNKVRERAGVTLWTPALLAAKGKTALQAVLEERFVECFMEGYRYYDIRRYLQGHERLSAGRWMGLNAIQTAPSFESFNTVVNINQPFEWNDRMYLLPISNSEVYSNPNMVQAPGY